MCDICEKCYLEWPSLLFVYKGGRTDGTAHPNVCIIHVLLT